MSHPKPKRLVDKALIASYRLGTCMICNKTNVDPCHIRSRGSGGPDADFNLLRLCREHHSMQHQCGFIKMMEKYPILILILKAKGWSLDRTLGLHHPELFEGREQ